MTVFTGSGTALVTPFTEDGINFKAFSRQIDFQLENGTDALVVLGTTGEPATMTAKEKEEAIKFVVEKAEKCVPVIAGTGGNCTAKVIEDSQNAQKLGADALLIVLPYYNYNKNVADGLIKHHLTIADNVDIPIIVYNVPSRTVINMTAETLAEIAQHKNIAGIKEASCNIHQVEDMVRLCDDNIDVYSGDDFIVLPLLAAGGKGVISVVSNIAPKEMHNLVESYMRGDISLSRQIQYRLNPLTEALFSDVNPIPVKQAMNFMGMEAGPTRMPLYEMREQNKLLLKKAMKDFGISI